MSEKQNHGLWKKGRSCSIFCERHVRSWTIRLSHHKSTGQRGLLRFSWDLFWYYIDNLTMIASVFTSHPFAILFHMPVYTIHVPSVYLNLTIGKINPCQQEFEDLLFDRGQHSFSFNAIWQYQDIFFYIVTNRKYFM